MHDFSMTEAGKILASLRAITIKLNGTNGEAGVLKSVTELIDKLEKNKTDYSGLIQSFKHASESLSSAEGQNTSFQREIITLVEAIGSYTSTFDYLRVENEKVMSSANKIVKYLDEFDTVLIEMTVRDEIRRFKKATIKEVRDSIKSELQNQKLRWSYLLAGGLGLYLLGGASFYIINYIVMGVKL
ncbi:MAG: hypothetical protein COA44_02175 [Arcobacter sp.]|nr:MAG: hypothetical protein COA44_02175 [Arcobacter sp.]